MMVEVRNKLTRFLSGINGCNLTSPITSHAPVTHRSEFKTSLGAQWREIWSSFAQRSAGVLAATVMIVGLRRAFGLLALNMAALWPPFGCEAAKVIAVRTMQKSLQVGAGGSSIWFPRKSPSHADANGGPRHSRGEDRFECSTKTNFGIQTSFARKLRRR